MEWEKSLGCGPRELGSNPASGTSRLRNLGPIDSSFQGLGFLIKLGQVWQNCYEDEVGQHWGCEPSLSLASFPRPPEARGGDQAGVGRSPTDSGGSSRTGYLHVTLLLP